MSHSVILGNRRFTCLSASLVRIEFAPGAAFNDQRSILAHAKQIPQVFATIEKDGIWDVLTTADIEIRTTANHRPCDRISLEIRWSDGKLRQFWRPDDRDHQNIGGALRSLDCYSGESCALDGVHTATMESPDVSGTNWPVWIHCEVDPLYKGLHTNPPANLNHSISTWLRDAQQPHHDGHLLERTFNWYKDARKFCPGVLSRSGYCLLNDSASAVMDADDFPVERTTPGSQDWYFFAYGTNYQQALSDFRLLCGPAPLPRHKSLGIMFSRWPAFTETEVTDMARDFSRNGYPMSTLIMDMEWHKEGWGHWEFSPELIPDPQRFFALCRSYGLDVSFNDHPLDVREDDVHFVPYVAQAGPNVDIRTREYNGKHLRMAKVDICDKQQSLAFSSVCHTNLLAQGIDYWWNDGSRGQLSATAGQMVANKIFFEESEREGRRGMLLARYGGLGSHRYGACFTGDANSDYSVLRLECEFTIRMGGVGVSNVSHDIGGFGVAHDQLITTADGVAIMPPHRYLRWLQFGVFNPILRFHSAPGCGSRKPYDYDTAVNGACRHWLRIRHSLLPYIYTAMRCHHDSGIPLVRGLFLDDSRNPLAYRWDQYFFGHDMLVAPLLTESNERQVYLPNGQWWEFKTDTVIAGNQAITRTATPAEMPVYIRAGSIIPRQSPDAELHGAHINELILDVYSGANATAELYEDDGTTNDYKNGRYARTQFTLRQSSTEIILTGTLIAGIPFAANRSITIRLHHLQGITAACLIDDEALPLIRESPRCQMIVCPPLSTSQPWSITMACPV